jgi:hypothetical protein
MGDRRAVGLLAALVLSGLTACAPASGPDTGTPAPAPAPSAAPVPVTTVSPAALPEARPVSLSVPAIDVRTDRLIDLGLTPTGEMEVPDDAVTAGWLTLGPTPGEVGPAVIAAHVDYEGVPGVFTRLDEMEPGDEVAVRRADGTVATFSAYRVERFAKSRFPTEDVYGDTDAPELRLITCGGAFDSSTRNYLDNVVVFARSAGGR